MKLGLHRTTRPFYSQFKVSYLGKMTNRGMKSSPEGKSSNAWFNLTDEKDFPSISESRTSLYQSKRRIRIDLHTSSKQKQEEVQKICPLQLESSASNSYRNDTDLSTSSGKCNSSSPINYKPRSTDNEHLWKKSASNSYQNDTDLSTSSGKSNSSSPINYKPCSTDNEHRWKKSSRNPKYNMTCHESNQNDKDSPTSSRKSNSSSPVNHKLRSADNEHRGKKSSRNPEHHNTCYELNQNETDLPTCFGQRRSSSPRNRNFRQSNNEHRGNNLSSGNPKFFKIHQDHREVKRGSRSPVDTSIDEPFDICPPETRRSGSKISVNKDNRNKWVPKVQLFEDNDYYEDGMEQRDYTEDSVEETKKVLRPGMVLFKHYLSPSEQVDIVSKCRELGIGPGGFYRPGYNDGAKLRLYMMCLGLDWNPQTKRYGETRHHDNAAPPDIPKDFTSLVCRALDDSHTLIKSVKSDSEAVQVVDELPLMSPDVCIVNFYTTNGRLGLHQDRDESRESLSKGLPVVSISVGDSAEFLYGDDRDVDKAESVLLESGDVLIFGGDSRHIFHGVTTIYPNTAPSALLKKTNLRPGRLNLTFRKY